MKGKRRTFHKQVFIELVKEMPIDERTALVTQVERLYQEERDEGREDSYVYTILETLKQLT